MHPQRSTTVSLTSSHARVGLIATARRVALAALVAAGPTAAVAADCDTPYSTDMLLADLIATESALRDAKNDDAKSVASRMATGLGCLDTALPRQLIGRAYRAIGAGLVAGGDASTGAGWFRTATEVDQSYDYGVGELPADSPVRGVYLDAKAVSADLEVLAQKRFVEGEFKLDGRGIKAPAARPDRPHLLQRVDGSVVSWVFQGASFPDGVIEEAVLVAVAPEPEGKPKKEKKVKAPKAGKEKVAKAPKDKPEKSPKPEKDHAGRGNSVASDGSLKRKRPAEKTPLMVAGGVILGAAGGVYYMAGQKRSHFNGSNDMDEVDQLQGQVNRLVVASAAVAAVGAGTLTWGIILDGHGAVPTVRVRF